MPAEKKKTTKKTTKKPAAKKAAKKPAAKKKTTKKAATKKTTKKVAKPKITTKKATPKKSSGVTMDVKPPKIIPSKVGTPLPDKASIQKPEVVKKSLTHKVIPLDKPLDTISIDDVKPDTATPRRKLAPLELPIKGSKSMIPGKTVADTDKSEKTNPPEPQKVEEPVVELDLPDPADEIDQTDPFEDILHDLEESDEQPIDDEAENKRVLEADKKEVTLEEAEKDYKKNKIATTTKQEEVQQEAEEEQPPKEVKKKPTPTPVAAYAVQIKDRHRLSSKVYVVEFLIVLLLVAVFFLILADAEMVDLGFELPFDLL